MNAQTITRPNYGVTSLKAALAWHWRGWHLSEKMDGVCVRREFAGCSVWGDALRDGRLFIWDIDRAFGQDVRRLAWTERNVALDELFSQLNPNLNWHRCATGAGAEFIEAILAKGGEGVICKPMDAPFGACWLKVKRQETFDCIVTEKNIATGSIRLALNGEDCGWCPARRAFDQIRVGDIVEIIAYGRHASGKFREAHFKKIRTDKMEQSL
jgi:hypothetical protein